MKIVQTHHFIKRRHFAAVTSSNVSDKNAPYQLQALHLRCCTCFATITAHKNSTHDHHCTFLGVLQKYSQETNSQAHGPTGQHQT